MHILTIEYTTPPESAQAASLKTCEISEWLVNYEVYGCVCAANKIAFDTDKMRNLAILWLCDEQQIARLRLG
jgi:hypothetical protein